MLDVSHVYLYLADITVKCSGCPAYCCGESAVAEGLLHCFHRLLQLIYRKFLNILNYWCPPKNSPLDY